MTPHFPFKRSTFHQFSLLLLGLNTSFNQYGLPYLLIIHFIYLMPPRPRQSVHHAQALPCPFSGCSRTFRNASGRTKHYNTYHLRLSSSPSPFSPTTNAEDDHSMFEDAANPSPAPQVSNTHFDSATGRRVYTNRHPYINGISIHSYAPCSSNCLLYYLIYLGVPCDREGKALPPGTPPPLRTTLSQDDWFPFDGRLDFEMADWLFKKTQMPRNDINFLMDAFASFGHEMGKPPPFANVDDLHRVIDSIPLGDAPWHSFTGEYQGPRPEGDVPSWMTSTYEI